MRVGPASDKTLGDVAEWNISATDKSCFIRWGLAPHVIKHSVTSLSVLTPSAATPRGGGGRRNPFCYPYLRRLPEAATDGVKTLGDVAECFI